MKRRIVSTNYQGLFQPWEIAIVKKLVKEFQDEWPSLKMEEPNDLYQECFIHWFFKRDQYDRTAGASRQTFMAKVVRRRLIDLVRERESDKRKASYIADSLDEPIGNEEDSPTLADMIDESAVAGGSSDPFFRVDFRIDISRALKKFTPNQKKLWRLLREEELTITEASDYLKTPRSTIYDELKRIGELFQREGLRGYLK